jgi:hypothetical protein
VRLDHLLSKVYRKKKGFYTSECESIVLRFSKLSKAGVRECASFCEKPTGGVAQLGEHLPCKQGVSGSIPLISTNDEQRALL